MSKKVILDNEEQDLENHFESMSSLPHKEERLLSLKKAATEHVKKKKSITIRLSESDLEVMQLKASKLGIPYQTYINMIIHKDAVSGF
jgi:predicted DNA binding CopG/RHH family protein